MLVWSATVDPMSVEEQPTRVVMIRHGQSESNAGGWLSGQDTCGGLTPLGVAQAERLRDRLVHDVTLQPDVVLVSTMARAVETAEILARPLGLAIEQRAELIERTSGEAEGLTIAQYTEKYGVAPWSDWHGPLSPGGESGAQFSDRVVEATDRLLADYRGKTLWVVCHGGVIMMTAVRRWGASPSDTADFVDLPIAVVQNTSVSEWLVDANDRWRMVRFGDDSHLLGLDVGVGAITG